MRVWKSRGTVWCRCLDCGERQRIPRKHFIRAARPHCRACGSISLWESNEGYSKMVDGQDARRAQQQDFRKKRGVD